MINIKDLIRKIFFVIGLLVFSLLTYNLVTDNLYQVKVVPILIGTALYLLILYALWKIYNKLYKYEKIITTVTFILFIIAQLVFAYYFVLNPSWDFGAVFTGAINDIEGTSSIFNQIYFHQFQNNLGIVLLFKTYFLILKSLGILGHYTTCALILNIAFIDIGLIYLYRLLRLVTDKKYCYLFLLMMLKFTPFITYVPVYYTDTLSLPFAIIGIYYSFRGFNDSSYQSRRKYYFILGGLAFGVGACIKVTVLIPFIATFIWLIIRERTDRKSFVVKTFALMTVIIVIPTLVLKLYTGPRLNKEDLNKYKIPTTHWIMMGLTGNGGFNEKESAYTVSFKDLESKKKANIKVIKERINKYIEEGTLLKFYNNKLKFAWADGTFFASEKLNREPKQISIFSQYIYGEKNIYYLILANAEWLVALSLILLGIIFRKYLTYKQRDLQLLSLITTIGILLFLLIWENRSRYIVNLLPVILVSSYLGIISIKNFIEIKLLVTRK